MAKRPTLIDITAGYGSNTQHNANNDEIETAFDNTLSRDGSSPNSMEADLDMNGNDLLNVGSVNGGGLEAAVSRGLIEEYLVDTKVQLESASIGTGVKFVRTNGYTTQGDGGAASYKKVNNEPSHNLKVQSGDGAWWELVPDPMGINVKQAGAVGDNSTDDHQAFVDAIDGIEDIGTDAADNKATHPVIVPAGRYLLNSTLELKRIVHLQGHASGLDNKPNSVRLRFPSQTTGIIIHNQDTIGATTEGTPTGGANGSRISGFEIISDGGTIAGVTDDTKGNGIWFRARAELDNVSVYDFPGNGIHIVADSGGGAATKGNANGWGMYSVRSTGNHKHGIFVDGADTNSGSAFLVDADSNGRAGIYDTSFLGNTWVGTHTSNNGLADVGENGSAESSFVDFGGEKYIAHKDATEADLVATQPGADATVWIPVGSGSANITWQASQPEGTYFAGGGYLGDAGDSILIGAYHETGQTPAQWDGVLLGGQFIENWSDQGFTMKFSEFIGRVEWKNTKAFPTDPPDREVALDFFRESDVAPLRVRADGDSVLGLKLGYWDESGGRWEALRHGNTTVMHVTSDLTTATYGRASAFDAAYPVFERGVVVGSGGGARHMTNATAAPTTGEHARGEIVWNQEPSAGGKAGWICVSGGTPGTWKQFGAIDA